MATRAPSGGNRELLVGLTIGHTLSGKYRLLRLLGDGGMGAVFEAQHEKLGTRVAIKVIHPEISRRPGIVDRFLQEARVSAQIKSPHVTQVIDVDQTADGEAYMVMELLEGQTLLGVLDREKKLPLATAAQYTIQILEGLEAAHALGVVHRDLKPENVFVTFTAKKPVLKLIDFGIAKVRRDDPAAKNLTMAGVTMGTAEYMAPEQAFSADRADARSDVYAVGVMFYEMLSGTRPVLGEDARVVATKVEQGDVTPLIHIVPEVPPPIAGLIHQAMAPRPELRFQSAAEMRLALENALSGAPRAVIDPAASTAPAFDKGIAPVVPGAAQLAEQPAGPHTVRGGGPVDPSAFSPMPPIGAITPAGYTPPPGGPMPMPVYGGGSAPPRRSSGGGGGMWLLVAGIAILLGVALVVGLALRQREPDVVPVATATGTATVAPTLTTATATGTEAIQPLATLGTVVVPPPGTGPGVRPPLVDGASPVKLDAGAADAGTVAPPAFPFPFPPMQDGGGLTFPPMPSGFPPIPTFPGFGAPPPQQ